MVLAAALASIVLAPSDWTLALGGDVMLNGIAPKSGALAHVAPLFANADLAILNLEIPLTTATTRTSRKSAAAIARKDQFVLKADPAHVSELQAAGIDAVSLANNHAMDYGAAGLREMLLLLGRAGIDSAGAGSSIAEAERPAVLGAPGGFRVALVSRLAFRSDGGLNACSPAAANASGIAVLRFGGIVDDHARARLRSMAAAARRVADVSVLALHWGLERKQTPTSYQVALGRAAIDAGFDVVVGHHPHVLQGAESYRGKPILYSLGNIVSAIGGSTAVLMLHMRGGTMRRIDVVPCRIAGGKVSPLEPSASKAALRAYGALCSLVQKAFPHSDSKEPPLALADPIHSSSRRIRSVRR